MASESTRIWRRGVTLKGTRAGVGLLIVVIVASLSLSASAAVTEYETHDSIVTGSTYFQHRFVRVLNDWTYGGPYGGYTTYSESISTGWSVSPSCSWDFLQEVSASLGVSVGQTWSRSGGCSYPVPAYTYGRCIQEKYGYDKTLHVIHYVWQNLYQSPPAGESTVVVPCATLVRIYDTYPSATVPSGTNYAPQYTTQP